MPAPIRVPLSDSDQRATTLAVGGMRVVEQRAHSNTLPLRKEAHGSP
jgi:hypothetical protein